MIDWQAHILQRMAVRGVTQRELAKRVGRAQSHVSYHLNPYTTWKRPSQHLRSLARLASALDR